jgi:V/A-type H+-transporting ATPase subunit B
VNRTPGSPPSAQKPETGRAAADDPSIASVAGIVPTPLAFSGAAWVEGPLLAVRGVEGVGWDEFARVRLASGEVRTGLVLEVHHDLAIVEVLQGTGGIDPERVSVAFEGRPFDIPVGEGWLGRVWNGMGEPLDGGPPMLSGERRAVAGSPLNPTARDVPSDPVFTGISVIDALTTLVRGQKLPIFSSAGLPHLDLAAQIAAQANVGGESFKVVVAAMGLTHADAAAIVQVLEARSASGDLVLVLDTAGDPVVQRILTPRVALTIAEYLAFEHQHHVLVVLADMTSYCEAVREVSAARGEIPGRRAYPGYLYSDLASIYERCGRLRDRPGSITQVPVLTMPGGDITHPVPDLTGYITEGQIVLSPERYAEGLYPPVDVLSSLSRLMRKGAGPGRTRGDHLALAGQLVAALARARAAQELADLIGMEALTETDRKYLAFNDAFSRDLVMQLTDESRGLEDTLDRAWRVLSILPERELTMMPAADIATYYLGGHQGREQNQPVDGGPQEPEAGPPVTEGGEEVPRG